MKKLLLIILTALLVCSCGAYKRLAYLQDMDALTTYDVTRRPDPRIARGDKLNITVSSSQPVLAAPVNTVAASATYNAVTEQSSYTSTEPNKDGYLVDQKGYINFPVLGPIFVEGMTLEDLRRARGKALVRREVGRAAMQYSIDGMKDTVATNGVRALMFSPGTVSHLKTADYVFMGFKLARWLMGLRNNRRRRR